MASRIKDWSAKIRVHEGYYPGSPSYRNNNPGNLRCSALVMGELGATKCVNNLAVFPSLEAGEKALQQFLIYACTNQLKSYREDMTLLQFYEKYAPSADHNNPLGYATAIAKGLGVSINTKIGDLLDDRVIPTEHMLTIYSQQNPEWASKKLGKSPMTIGRYGCTVTSIAMGKNYLMGTLNTPDLLAAALDFTADGLILWQSLTKIGLRLVSRIKGRNEPAMNQALNDPDKFCIVQVNSNHWCLIIGRKLPLLGYRIADPWFGDKAYTSRYKNNITGCAIIGKM